MDEECIHEYNVIDTCYRTCTMCGMMYEYVLACTYETCSYTQSHSPFFSGYSRSKRFKSLVSNILYPTTSVADDNMLKFFIENKLTPLQAHIEQTLRSSGLKDKRYGSIHLFSQLFSPDYKPIVIEQLRKHEKKLCFFFEKFEQKYIQLFYQGFISYNFVLEYLLNGLKLYEFIPFIKKTKCRRRLKHYKSQLKQLNFSFHIDT